MLIAGGLLTSAGCNSVPDNAEDPLVAQDDEALTGSDGNDIIGFAGSILDNATMSAGGGNDLIAVDANSSVILGEDGDDTIIASFGADTSIDGGTGNDEITVSIRSSAAGSVSGRPGNDTLGATNSEYVILFGDAGDDLLSIIPNGDNGAGFFTSGFGGDGNERDTLLI